MRIQRVTSSLSIVYSIVLKFISERRVDLTKETVNLLALRELEVRLVFLIFRVEDIKVLLLTLLKVAYRSYSLLRSVVFSVPIDEVLHQFVDIIKQVGVRDPVYG